MMTAALLFACLTLNLMVSCEGYHVNQTKQLLSDVLKDHDPRVRPSLNQSWPTIANSSFTLLSVGDLDEVEAVFSVTGFITLSWWDETLTWDPDAYGGITHHLFQNSEVWCPTLILAYPHTKFGSDYANWLKILILNTGFSTFSPGDVYKSKCEVDISYFPFDKQKCDLVFVSVGYTTLEFQFHSLIPHVNKGIFSEHGEWEIIETSSTAVNDPLIGPYMVFTFHLQRNPVYFVVNIIIPIIIMSLLNTLIFVLPPQSGERVSFGITVLLAFAVFLTIVGENLPKASTNMSLLSYFLVTNLSLSTLMCICAILNIHIYFKEEVGGFPWWARLAIVLTCSQCKTRHVRKSDREGATYTVSTETTDNVNTKQVNNAITNNTESKPLTWADISIMVDKLCFVFFFATEILCTISFVLRLTYFYLNPDSDE